jgi:hypothetical protein
MRARRIPCTNTGTIFIQFRCCYSQAFCFRDTAHCQTESFQALPPWPSPVEHTLQIRGENFTSVPPGTFERDARAEDSREQDATPNSPQPQNQTPRSDTQGLVMRSVRELWRTRRSFIELPSSLPNFKWDALVLGGTAALLATDRHIEKHIGTAHQTVYQASSDVAIGGLGATLGAVYL